MRNPAKAMNACEKAEQWQVALEVFKSISASPSEACQQSLVCVFFGGCMILNTIIAGNLFGNLINLGIAETYTS